MSLSGLSPIHGAVPLEHPSPARMGLTSAHCSFSSPQILQQNIPQACFNSLTATSPHRSSNGHGPKVRATVSASFPLCSPAPKAAASGGTRQLRGCRSTPRRGDGPALPSWAALPVLPPPPPTPGSDLLSQGMILVVSMEVAQNLRSKPDKLQPRALRRAALGTPSPGVL